MHRIYKAENMQIIPKISKFIHTFLLMLFEKF